MMQLGAHLLDAVIISCEYTNKEIILHLGASQDKVFVVPYGIDSQFQKVTDAQSLERVRRKYGISEQYVLYVGIYRERKNHAGLLQAFQHLVQSGTSCQLVIAGPMNEAEKELRRLAAELGIEKRMVLTGFV